jgi:alkyldihydroxyacetonephosphate synthase
MTGSASGTHGKSEPARDLSSGGPSSGHSGGSSGAGPGGVPPGVRTSTDPVDLRMVSHDMWPRRLLELRDQLPGVLPHRVFWPDNDDEVVEVVRAARVARRPLVPFGAGSGVCGGISPTTTSWMLDLKRMSRVGAIDPERGTCVCEAGVIGERLEETLNARGLTLGHFPSSIYSSTVGGWVATRGAGQLSSRYGKIEDMVLAVEGVDGRGRKVRAAVDDPRTGPGAVQLLVGSEGALLVITRVTLRVRALASHRWLRGFSFEDLGSALAAMRSLMQNGEGPSVLRLYDPVDATLSGPSPQNESDPDRIAAGGISRANIEDSGPRGDGTAEDAEPTLFENLAERVDELALFSRPRAARRIVGEILGRPTLANAILDRVPSRPRLVIGLEGTADELGARVPGVKARLIAMGGKDLGDEPGARWLRHRHRVSYRMSRAFAVGSWVDTFEVATGWERVVPLYRDVREALRDVAVVMCHMSHAYHDGCSLYFTFAGFGAPGTGPRSALSRYDLAWERALSVARRHGAALSHHHGLGRSKVRGHKLAPGARALLEGLKRALDPDGVLNPGVLGLGGPPGGGPA